MSYGSDSDRRMIGMTVVLTFIVVGVMYWAGHTGDTAGKSKTSGTASPQTAGSGVSSRPATGPDTSGTAGR